MDVVQKLPGDTSLPYDKVEAVIDSYQGDPSAIIPILQDVQDLLGYIPKTLIPFIGEKIKVPPAKIYGVATFYAQFRLQPVGKHIVMVCVGTACHVNGAKIVGDAVSEYLNIKEGETTPDGLFTYEKVACLGCCSLSPVMMIDGQVYSMLTPEKVRKILKGFQKESAESN